MEPLHDDDPTATVEVTTEDASRTGFRMVRNLTAEEYAATYAEGGGHVLPVDVEVELEREAARIATAREG